MSATAFAVWRTLHLTAPMLARMSPSICGSPICALHPLRLQRTKQIRALQQSILYSRHQHTMLKLSYGDRREFPCACNSWLFWR